MGLMFMFKPLCLQYLVFLKENDSYVDEQLNEIIYQPLDVDLAIFFHPTCCIQVHCKFQIQVMHITDFGDTMSAFFTYPKHFGRTAEL